jgi:alkanesulfonate monooxygenase SsuD/methylene tetrahydromethanopterin reductase-like flavin-dependent oxidoreductase (luciferase family)
MRIFVTGATGVLGNAVVPGLRDASRADLTREGIEALRALFKEPRSSYRGTCRRFQDVESFPKPIQSPLPIYSGGNVEGPIQRAASLCEGWLPAKIGLQDIRVTAHLVVKISDSIPNCTQHLHVLFTPNGHSAQ